MEQDNWPQKRMRECVHISKRVKAAAWVWKRMFLLLLQNGHLPDMLARVLAHHAGQREVVPMQVGQILRDVLHQLLPRLVRVQNFGQLNFVRDGQMAKLRGAGDDLSGGRHFY